jgi:hypothetical protein
LFIHYEKYDHLLVVKQFKAAAPALSDKVIGSSTHAQD